jgi:hypothetical protein
MAMARRGRQTIEDQIWASGVPITPGEGLKAPSPPASLVGAEERKLWKAIVGRLIPSYFPIETHSILAAYCRHSVICDELAKRAHALKPQIMNDATVFEEWCKIGREMGFHSGVICQLGTKLRLVHSARLTQQIATIDAQSQPAAPWTDWGSRARKDDSDDDEPPKSN